MRTQRGHSIKQVLAYLLCIGVIMASGIPLITSAGMEDKNLAVVELLTNGVKNPQAIDAGSPRFSWKLEAEKRNTLQFAYQIIVTEKLSPGKTVWDSGRVESGKSSGVLYGGQKLLSDTPYLWKVRIWTNHGDISTYSEEGVFRIGLSYEDWTASYIWDHVEKPNDFTYFRKSFSVEKTVANAVVYVSAHNDYQLYLNGEKLGAGPARSDPYEYGQYCAYDITEELQNGGNTFATLAHWHGVWSNSGTNAKPAFILEARIRYTDGTSETVKTDGSWKIMGDTPYIEENPVYFGHYGGERNRASIRYDARRELPGWANTGFDDKAWGNAGVVDRPEYRLYAQLVGEQTEMEREVPLAVTKEGDRWLVDFGKCLTGWPEIKLHEQQSGNTVKVQYWEVEKGWGDAGYDTYTAKGGEEVFYAPFVRHTSFRILEITGYKGTLTADDVRGIVAYSYAGKTGSFESSDPRLNDVYIMSERSGRQNIQQGIISVDANREQSPWTADSWNIGIGYLYNHENTMVLDKIIKDYAGEQRESGNFLCCSPARDYPSEMAEWSLYWPMMLWEQYLFAGDEQLLADYYPNLIKFLTYIEKSKNPGTGLYNPAGWRSSDYAGGSLESYGENIATNSHIYRNYEIAAQVASITGNRSDAERFDSLAKALKTNINRHLLKDGKAYKSTPGSAQTHPLGTAWALRFDIVPQAFRDRVITWMASQKNAYDVGGYGGDALYNGLYGAGLGFIATNDFARYDQMLQSNNTNWESFGELSIDNMGNHAWTAYPSYILQKYVGGITPTSGGFASFDVKPVIGGLDFAKAEVPTVKGLVKTAWEKVDRANLTLSVSVPAGTTARIFVPDHDLADITVKESNIAVFAEGRYLPGVDGISSGEQVPDYIVFTVGSGIYEFHVSGTPQNTPELGVDAKTEFILDDGDAVFGGPWFHDTVSEPEQRYGNSFRYMGGAGEATAAAEYTAVIEQTGIYHISAWWVSHENRAKNTPYTITCADFAQTIRVNQEENGGQWNLLHTMELKAGDTVTIKITNDADEYVIADAVRISLDDGVVIDDNEAVFQGKWIHETASNHIDRYGNGFRYASPVSGDPTSSALYETAVTADGEYGIYAWWGIHSNRAKNTPYTITCGDSAETVRVNQEENGGQWNLLSKIKANAGDTITVKITNDADEYVIADAVKISPYIGGGEEEPLTPYQELQLFLYDIYLPETETCTDFSLVSAFRQALEEAEVLCAAENPSDVAAAAILDRLKKTIQDVLNHQKDNLALNRSVSASEEMAVGKQWSKDFLTDGIKTRDNGVSIGYTSKNFTSKDLQTPIDLTIDLGSVKELNHVVLYPRLGTASHTGGTANFPENYEIQVSTDGSSFKTVKTVTGQPDPDFQRVIRQFSRESARYVRLHVTRLGEYAGDEGGLQTPYRLQFSEVEIYNETEYYDITMEYDTEGGTIYGNTENIEENTEITLIASPKNGWIFEGWYAGDTQLSKESAYTLQVTSDMTIEARFYQPADKTALGTLLEEADRVNTDLYTAQSVKVFMDAKAAAGAVYENLQATRKQVDDAVQVLENAINQLAKKPEDINKTALGTLLEEAGRINTDLYTAQSVKVFMDAKAAAGAVYDDPQATQKQVDDAVQVLENATKQLVEKPEDIDKTVLGALLERAEGIDTRLYNAQSVKIFMDAKAVAKAVYENPQATREQIDGVTEVLEMAIAALVKADTSSEGESSASSSSPPSSAEPNDSGKSGSETQSQPQSTGVPKTGDKLPILSLALIALSGLGILLLHKNQAVRSKK